MPSTGTIYWQMNKGWPSLLWFLWNNDGDQAGSYFGAQEANRPLHALYALDNGTVTLDNLSNTAQSGLSVESKVYNLAGTVTRRPDREQHHAEPASRCRSNVLTPKVPTTPAGTTYFVELQLKQNGTLVDRNVYWLSTQQDADELEEVASASRSASSPPTRTSPAWRRCRSPPSRPPPRRRSRPARTAPTWRPPSPSPTPRSATVAFLLRADVRRGTASGGLLSGDNELQSSIWQNNDITLFPGESQTLTVTYDSSDLQGANTPVISVSGWNVPQVNIPAPVP